MKNKFKVSTFIWIAMAIFAPYLLTGIFWRLGFWVSHIHIWMLSIPICGFMAYRSFKSETAGTNGAIGTNGIEELEKAANLYKSGALSEEEFQKIKADSLKG